ncbi:O-methyltransferase [Clostridium oryzae]|uniref:Putative O-methyltransferase n=1 Tax=Clostridium oryzae TaxID=1450648 RepID=A0A1V4ISV4_9CLOT|nr:O-methyltransferase [Clostridium oryzae]OPJ63092.1 putative O-methyltransferase [Clostridium oryzae]
MDFEVIGSYIKGLYEEKEKLNRQKFIRKTKLKDFIPVVDDDVARMLKLLVAITKPKNILEIGTSIGFSAASMAETIKDYGGKITTIEYDEKVAAQAKQNFINTGVAECIEIKIGDAREIVPELDVEYDLIFQDVDKNLYPALFKDCLRILRKGGILVAEDTLFPVLDLDPKWHSLIPPIKEFNDMVINCKQLDSTIVPIGDGFTIAFKR